MALKEILREKLLPIIEQENLELIEIDCSDKPPYSFLRIYVDKAGGINIEECARLSQIISDCLDTEDIFKNRFTLEVSSPGLERPLLNSNDFRRKIGKEVKIYLKTPHDQKNEVTGKIENVTKGKVTLRIRDKAEAIPLEIIDQGKIII